FEPDGHRPILDATAALAREGLTIAPQVACRPLLFDFDFAEPFLLSSFPFFAAAARADREGKKLVYGDPAFRRAFRAATDASADGRLAGRWERTWVSHCPGTPEMEERLVADLARERGCDAVDLVLDLALASDLALRLRMAIANLDEDDVAELLSA